MSVILMTKRGKARKGTSGAVFREVALENFGEEL